MATPTQIGKSISNVPTIQRLYAEDYKNAPSWFTQQFISTMNLFMQSVYTILNQGIDVTLNCRDEIYSFSFPCNSATASGNTYSFIPKKFIGAPSCAILGQCYDASAATPSAVGNPVTFDWYFNAGRVIILAIYGLTNGHTYQITLRLS